MCGGWTRHYSYPMATFLYQCPFTRRNVQGWAADDTVSDDRETFVPVTCLACGTLHLVNPKTGKTASGNDKK